MKKVRAKLHGGYRILLFSPMRGYASNLIKIIGVIVFCIFQCLTPLSASTREYEIKAAFLCNFIKFVEWPSTAFASDNSPIIIAIIGQDPFGDSLDEAVAGKTVGDRGIIIKRMGSYRSGMDLSKYHVMFVSTSEQGKLAEILQAIHSAPVLTVSEIDQFARHGGIIKLAIVENKMRFEACPKNAEKAQIALSSKILKLAVLVNN